MEKNKKLIHVCKNTKNDYTFDLIGLICRREWKWIFLWYIILECHREKQQQSLTQILYLLKILPVKYNTKLSINEISNTQ